MSTLEIHLLYSVQSGMLEWSDNLEGSVFMKIIDSVSVEKWICYISVACDFLIFAIAPKIQFDDRKCSHNSIENH